MSEKTIAFTQRGHARPAAALPSDALDRLQCHGTADPVDDEATVALEVLECMSREWTEDAVDLAAIEPEPADTALKHCDVVAAQVRGREEQQPVAQPTRCFDKAGPCVLAAQTIDGEASRVLKLPNGCLGRATEKTGLGDRIGQEPGGAEAALQITDGFSALARDQGEVTRNSSSSCSS